MNNVRLRAVEAAKPRAIAYIRVSRERDDMISPELQETAIRDHCARCGYDLIDILEPDLDRSGRFWKRRRIEDAVARIEAGTADVIVVWKISRVARNRLDWNIAVDRVESAGGRLESATEPVDASTSSGRFSRGVLAELAAFESERAGEMWHETHQRRWRNGLPHHGRPQFGYTYDRASGYAPDPDIAPLAREMYERFVAGSTGLAIADWLRPMNLGNMRTYSSVLQWMDRGFAAGFIVHHDPSCTLPHPTSKRHTCRNVVREQGAHTPLISDQLWAGYLEARAARADYGPRLKAAKHLYSGLAICTACGRRITHARHHTQGSVYRCNNRTCRRARVIPESRIEEAILAWLPTVADDVSRSASSVDPAPATARAERSRLERVASEAEAALTRLTVDRARRVIPEDAYIAARDELIRERDEAARSALRIRTNTGDQKRRKRLAANLLATWDRMTEVERNAILRELCVVHFDPDTPRVTLTVFGAWQDMPDLPRTL